MGSEQDAQRNRKREHPLTYRHVRDDVIDQVGGAPTMRRAPHEGQMPRRLQENATSFSCAHAAQRSRRKPCAKMPQSRKPSNSSLINSGKLAPVSASTCARNVSRCSWTNRYRKIHARP
jgi:hypothetical protein